MTKKNKTVWRWWAKSLGEKASKCDKESDTIALIRTVVSLLLELSVIGMILSMIDQSKDSITLHQTKSNEIQNSRKIRYFWGSMLFSSV